LIWGSEKLGSGRIGGPFKGEWSCEWANLGEGKRKTKFRKPEG